MIATFEWPWWERNEPKVVDGQEAGDLRAVVGDKSPLLRYRDSISPLIVATPDFA